MPGVVVSTTIDLSAIYSMVDTFTFGLADAERFAANKTREAIRRDVLNRSIRALCYQAGEGFPQVYTDHLVEYMRLNTQVRALNFGRGQVEIEIDFGRMGDWGDLELGYHSRAMIEIEEGQAGYQKNGKSKFIIHPPLVDLPYQGEDLHSDDSTRKEFFEKVVYGRETWDGGPRNVVIPSASFPVDTFEETAEKRVDAWKEAGVAPQYLLLDTGYTEGAPVINPVNFSASLENIIHCVASEIYTGAMTALIHIAEEAGESIRVVGGTGPRSSRTGRYVKFKDALAEVETDYSHCLFNFY